MDSLNDVAGLQIGHWTDSTAQTGCTVLLFDVPALAACDIRGAAPGSRELALLSPGRAVQRADAILLTGGSAFGLAAADGVMQWLKAQGRGYPTPAGPVPIVPAAVIYDLATGNPDHPTSAAGYEAVANAVSLSGAQSGRIGAGAGATFGKIRGPNGTRPGGCAISQISLGDSIVTAVVVLNAFGDIYDPDASDPRSSLLGTTEPPPIGESTTLMVCVTDLPLDHDTLLNLTVAMHDGLARSIRPAHTILDGDIAFAVALNDAPAPTPALRLRASLAAELAVETAIRDIVALP